MTRPDKTSGKLGQSETDAPWKYPGQASQDPGQVRDPDRAVPRERRDKDNETA
jgi:hypothetical protein